MPTLTIGFALALLVAAFARVTGLDRDRAFYPVVLIVVGSYYILFAVMAGMPRSLAAELGFFALFAAIAVIGFRTSLWAVAAGLVLHGLFDLVRHRVAAGDGVPGWWPDFCLGYDVGAGLCLAAILYFRRRPGGRGHA